MGEKTEKQEILEQKVMEEEKPSDALLKQLEEKQKLVRKKQIKYAIIGAVGFVFVLLVWWLFKPYKASADYGICRSFLELQVSYPHTIYVSEIKPLRGGGLKLWYTHIDAFGEYRLEEFQCKLVTSPDTGTFVLESARVHNVDLSQERVAYLNAALPYFEANPLILDWPYPLPDSLSDLHFEFDRFRRILLNPNKY